MIGASLNAAGSGFLAPLIISGLSSAFHGYDLSWFESRTPIVSKQSTFEVRGDYIMLGQLVKMAGIAGTGGEAKAYVSESEIRVNDEPENRRGRKLRPGDRVELPGVGALLLTSADSTED